MRFPIMPINLFPLAVIIIIMSHPRRLADIPPLRRLLHVPEDLLPPPGHDIAPHREGVCLAREDGALFFIFRMSEFRRADGPRPNVLHLCSDCAENHNVRYLSLT